MKSKLRQNKGITLIALVITIIVLLILAGVAIAMLTGENGLLQRAADTNGNSAYSTACEQVKLAYANLKTEILTQKHSNPNYNAQANGESLAVIVGRDLNGSEWSTPTYNSTDKAIEITYTNSSLRAGMVSEGKPAQSGEINFSIGILAQDVTLSIDGVEEYGSSEPEPPSNLISFTIDDVTYHAEQGMNWWDWAESEYSAGVTVGTNNDGLPVYVNNRPITHGVPVMPSQSSEQSGNGPHVPEPPSPFPGLPNNLVFSDYNIADGDAYYRYIAN